MANDTTWLLNLSDGVTASTSASAARPVPASNGGAFRQLRIAQTGNMFIAFGGPSVAATATDQLLIGSTIEYFTIPANATHYSVLALTGTPSFTISSGTLVSLTP